MSITVESTQNFIAIDNTKNSVDLSLVNVESLYDYVTPTLLEITHEEVG